LATEITKITEDENPRKITPFLDFVFFVVSVTDSPCFSVIPWLLLRVLRDLRGPRSP